MATKELTVFLVLIAVACRAVPMINYTASMVKPLFDQMYDYGDFKKNDVGTHYHQFLVVLVASHSEIVHAPRVNLTIQEGIDHFENIRFKDRVRFLLNDENHSLDEFNRNRPLHGEVQCIHKGILDTMLIEFRRIKPNEFPIVLIYSFYIPCANIGGLGYSCSEELAIFTCNQRKVPYILVAYSHIYNRTNEKKAIEFMSKSGIHGFRYQRNSNGDCDLIPAYKVEHVVHHFALLRELFTCINNTIDRSRFLTDLANQTAIIAYYVNSMGYECFKQEAGRLRDSNKQVVQSCFRVYAQKSIGYESKKSSKETVNKDREYITNCTAMVFTRSILLPGQPERPYDPFSDTWSSTADPKLNETFPESPESQKGSREICLEQTLTLESLCTKNSTTRMQRVSGRKNIKKHQTPTAAAGKENKTLTTNRKGNRKEKC